MRRIFILLISAFFFTSSYSQIKMGIKGSPQLTWGSTDSKSITTGGTNVNISYGLVLDYFISENYSFGTELTIGTYRGSITPDSVYVTNRSVGMKDLTYDYRMQYINIPFIIKMRTKEIGYMRYYAECGFGMSYRFKAKADISSKAINISDVEVNDPDPADQLILKNANNDDLSQKVNFIRTSIIFGAGIQYNVFGNTMLVAGLRYDNALNDFTDESKWKTRLNFLALHLGVMF